MPISIFIRYSSILYKRMYNMFQNDCIFFFISFISNLSGSKKLIGSSITESFAHNKQNNRAWKYESIILEMCATNKLLISLWIINSLWLMNECNINYNMRFQFYNKFVNPKLLLHTHTHSTMQSNRLPRKATHQISHYIAQQRQYRQILYITIIIVSCHITTLKSKLVNS